VLSVSVRSGPFRTAVNGTKWQGVGDDAGTGLRRLGEARPRWPPARGQEPGGLAAARWGLEPGPRLSLWPRS
jgi:hypothetical protein